MQRMFGFMVFAVLMLLAFGCSNNDNPMTTDPNQAQYKPNTPIAPAIGDRVWHDVNMDGIQGDTLEEPGLEGIVVHLYQCNDTIELAMTTTDIMGYYSFDTLTPGEYQLHFVLPEGYLFSPANQGDDDALDSDADPATGWTECVSIDSGEINLDVDAGMYMMEMPENAAIGDRVWHDVNMDGIQGDTLEEPGIEGVAVHLYDCEDTVALAMTTTDAMGYYSFDGLAPGVYQLYFALPEGYTFSPVNQGDDDELDSDADPVTGMTICFTIEEDVVDNSWDAGMYMLPVSEGCTRSKGYWKNHTGLGPQDDEVTDLLPILLGSLGADTTIVEIIIVDTIISDTTIVDTIIVDTTIVDTIIVDTTIVDTIIVDTIINDTLVTDTTIVDTTISDTTIVDSTISDTTIVETPISDTTIVDSTIVDTTISEDPGKSLEVTDAQMAYDILQQHTYGHPSNGITKLYAHFLATKLNIANGASDEDIKDAVAEADAFLSEYDWMDWNDLDKSQRKMVSKWKSMFAAYNGGDIGPGCCNDIDGDGDCDDGDDWDHDYNYDDEECDNDNGNGIDCNNINGDEG